MDCHKCGKRAEFRYVDKQLCRRCFTELVERNIRKHLRTKHSIEKKDTLVVVGPVAKWFVEQIITVPCKKIFKAKLTQKDLTDKKAKIILPWTMDDTEAEFLQKLFKNKLKSNKDDKRIIKLFDSISEQELMQFCKIKDIAYKRESSQEKEMLDKLEAKYPGMKNSLSKSIQIIEGL